MCGIAGFSGNFSSELLTGMGRKISHRGPDNQGQIILNPDGQMVGLCHTRLSIIDLSENANQPMRLLCSSCEDAGPGNPNTGLWITYNGELYNYRELRSGLEKKGHKFRSNSDTEVLLHLYAQDGIEMLKYLNGIFAFALYDGRNLRKGIEPTLWLVRDHFGIKPLYYAQTDRGILFSSELKAINQYDGLDRTLNITAIEQSLIYLWTPTPNTLFNAVKKLPPGFAYEIKGCEITRRVKYYSIPQYIKKQEGSEKEIAAELAGNLRTAVRRQLVSDVPVGAFLSGGLDSSSIVALAKDIDPSFDLPCFTIGFKGEQFDSEGMVDDLPYAEKCADYLGVKLNRVDVGPEMAYQLEDMIYSLDEPTADPAPLNVLFISQLARQKGIKVMLSGAGGDDIFTGYRRHRALAMEKYWRWTPEFVRKALAVGSEMLPVNSVLGRRLSKAFRYADMADRERLVSYFLWAHPSHIRKIFSKDYIDNLHTSPMMPLLSALDEIPETLDPLDKMLYLEQKFFLTDHNLNYTDKMGMATGVEIRVPFLDLDMVDFAQSIPLHMKQRGKEGKWIFKKAMEKYLPKDIIYRPKTGFGAPLRAWLHGPLKELLHDTFSSGKFRQRGIFNISEIENLIRLDRQGKIDASYIIFGILTNEIWMQKFSDRSI